MKKTKVAIACQGGGSQTAFTAGVLAAFFEKNLHLERQIVGLSGTSGGGVCAALAWYGLLKAAQGDTTPIQTRLLSFWNDIVAKLPPELYFDRCVSELLRWIDKGILPHTEMNPGSLASRLFLSNLASALPRQFFTDLRAALEAHIGFQELPALVKPDSPVLLLGAADVCSGQLKKFNSRLGEICVEAVLASAAIPTLFPAVQIGKSYYWDGLFSDNPPVKELLRMVVVGMENVPDELWVIQINPTAVDAVRTSTAEIIDRRNQMIGNVSLMQSLEFVDFWNSLLKEKAVNFRVLERLGFTRREPVTVRSIHMSPGLQRSLDYVSKLSREPVHIQRLIEDGLKQGRKFLKNLPPPRHTPAPRPKRRPAPARRKAPR